MANAGVMSTAAADLVRKAVLLASSLLFLAALSGCQPGTSEGIKFGWFYRMVVELSHGGEPLNMEVIIGCGSQVRQIPGEGRSARAIWAPYIFGVRTKNGEGVLVQSPNICDRDVVKEPVPADFLPVVFWAPDAGNLEFLVAYLHESAYEQPVSKLKFHRATITEATEADYRAWRETKWKDNIVPIGSRREDHVNGRSYFRGEGFFPKEDPRNKLLLRMSCYSFLRVPIPSDLQELIRAQWPPTHPHYWLLGWPIAWPILFEEKPDVTHYWEKFRAEARRRGLLDREEPRGLATFYEGKGVNRRSGVGHLERNPKSLASGQGLRIPVRVETGFPWATERMKTQGAFDLHADTANGADQGFAYCYRDLFGYYFSQPPVGELRAADHRILIDGKLIGIWPEAKTMAPGAVIVERDEYLWLKNDFPLTHELARMQ
ncbi:hypothetical protein JQ597_00740 [Bradyrhizobium sp. AUGA SZCCT0177]|uniref:hypothetical protein n=1 Tax=Bradyrhizobium sp. AUGA SZCCT0177 TaxID=2807665 RepID=UPI001BABFC78|nr:hypothetical protein [Bradyrhizobium sp. AUGA SZCCT0177]MBR1280558.1 hypothetical protein [Bradyrhizobium sp. AUGA SZCCT0177]